MMTRRPHSGLLPLLFVFLLLAGVGVAQEDPAFAPAGGGAGLVQGFTAPQKTSPGTFPAAPPLLPEPAYPMLTPVALVTPRSPIVIELFTSEGCSSCPPANAYLRELAGRPDLLPLSFHVDYWDYVGWKDRFADPAFTLRQRAYAAARGKMVMYTPQAIIGGAIDVIASDRKAVASAIDAAARRHPLHPLSLARDAGGTLNLVLPAARLSVPASLWLVTYRSQEASDVRGGENAGTRMITTNVVRSLREIGSWDGSAGLRAIALTTDEIATGPDGCAIIANEAGSGAVVGAVAWSLTPAP